MIEGLKHPTHSGTFVSKFGGWGKYHQFCLDNGFAKVAKDGVFFFILRPTIKEKTQSRNELCNCGSGKKFKKCCW